MSNISSVRKFKIKEDCVDELLETEIMKLSKDHFMSARLIRIDDVGYANIIKYESMDKPIDHQDRDLEWLDSIEHLLE